MDTIKCPVCGEVNPADNEFCRNCQSRLEPLTGPLKGENAPLQPGQVPTKKVTSELEPILPQWLREARQQARDTEGEEKKNAAQESSPTVPISRAPDLLAGLASQDDEDEDAPDWLVNITGNAPAKKKKIEPDDSSVKRVELGDFTNASSDATKSGTSTPSWMKPQEAAPEKDELANWLSQADQSPASFTDEKAAPVSPASSAPETPFGISDWLHDMQGESTFAESAPESSAPIYDMPDWLKNLDEATTSPAPAPAAPSSVSDDTPDWLKNLDAGSVSFESTPFHEEAPKKEQPVPSSSLSVPDWLKSFGEESPAPVADSSALKVSPSDAMMPNWLKAAAPSGNVPPVIQSEPAPEGLAPSAGMPDWLASLKPTESQPQESAPSALVPEAPIESAPPAFAPDSLSNNDVDAIFGSMQMPDWLSSAATPTPPPALENLPPAAQSSESIAPADLPSWVQAMRPVESALPEIGASVDVSSGAEVNGPLAGLEGVLPAMPGGIKPSSRTKSHALKLNASDEQQSHSALLEKILTEETSPVPMKSPSTILSQRVLRWVITALLFLFVGGIFFSRTQTFTLPSRVSNDETEAAISAMDAIPQGAPVLVVFDYEPSLAGELEATASPLFNRLLLLKHPNLAIVSTSPTGAALAERFMSTTMAERSYQRDAQYVDLGYLAGGLAGVYDFAQNPATVMSIGVDGTYIWQSTILQGKTHLSDFAAVIVLTDSAEAGRVWIEQAGPFRGNASLVVISSAQAAPMLMPYMQSQQINGLVSGLNSAAKIEQANGQPGLARRYWDAYSVGLLFAVIFIFLGGFWNFIIGLQIRRAKDAK